MDLLLESEEEQFTFQEFYCMLGPWARGRQKEVLAALKRLVNGYSVSPAKLIMDDDDDQSVDMDELVFRPPILRAVSSSATRTTRTGRGRLVSLVFRDTNLLTAVAGVCGVTLEPTPSVCAPTDRTPPPVCGPPRPSTGPPLRSVGLRWALKPRTRPVHYKMTLVL